MPLYFPYALYAQEISLIKTSTPKGELRTSFAVYNLSALHSFAFKVHLSVTVLPIAENPRGAVRPEITHSTCTALSNAAVPHQRFQFLNIKTKAFPTK